MYCCKVSITGCKQFYSIVSVNLAQTKTDKETTKMLKKQEPSIHNNTTDAITSEDVLSEDKEASPTHWRYALEVNLL